MGKIGDLEKITVFENSPEGVVTVKFTEAAAAEIATLIAINVHRFRSNRSGAVSLDLAWNSSTRTSSNRIILRRRRRIIIIEVLA